MRIKPALIFILISFVFGSCTTLEVVVNKTNVAKLIPGSPPKLNAVDYALPLTVLDVEVFAEKKITKPGPFAAYAERYLGVTNVPTREQTEWIIKEIKLKSHPERDQDQVYRIETEGISKAGFVKLDEMGIIMGVNMPMDFHPGSEFNAIHRIENRIAELPEYSDLTIHKNTEPMLDTIYRVVRTDTSFTRLPLLKSQVSKKTLMNQAEEAANLIMKLRKRRFYLLTGEYAYRGDVRTPMPEGSALEIIVRELAQLEYDYVSLFVGRTLTFTEIFKYSYTPEGQGLTEAYDLFVFSKFRGVLPAGSSNGDPVRIELTKISDPSILYSNTNYSLGDSGDGDEVVRGLAYRIPGQAQVNIMLNNQSIINKSFLIAQFGIIQFLPIHLVGQENMMIRFHPELGIIEGIYEK